MATIEYSSYVGKIAVGRLQSGSIRTGQQIVRIDPQGNLETAKVTQVYLFRNLQRMPVDMVDAGNIVAVAGIERVGIGDTLADPTDPRPLPPITVEEPTVRMTFAVNDSPFVGREGQYLTSRQVRAASSTSWSATSPCASMRPNAPTSSSSPVAASCTLRS